MHLKRRQLFKTVLSGIAPASLSSLSLGPGFARAAGISKSEIVLGTHLDLSGPAAVVMPPVRNGIQMRIDEANENGGVNGRRVRLVIEDNNSQPATAVRAVDKLIRRDEVFALLCPFGSGTNAATVNRVVDSGTICFAPFGASAALQQATRNNRLLFTTNPNYDNVAAAGVRWAMAELASRRVGLIYQDNQFGEQFGLGAKRALATGGLELVATAGHRIGEIDFSSHLSRMQAAQVDLILCGTATRESVSVCTELKKWGGKAPAVMVAPPSRNSLLPRLAASVSDGIFGIGAWRFTPTAETQAASLAWAARYRNRFNVEPEDTSYAFYGYADWFMQELERVGPGVDTEKMLQALRRSSYEGIATYGRQHFQNNHVNPEFIQIDRLQSGKWRPQSAVLNASLA